MKVGGNGPYVFIRGEECATYIRLWSPESSQARNVVTAIYNNTPVTVNCGKSILKFSIPATHVLNPFSVCLLILPEPSLTLYPHSSRKNDLSGWRIIIVRKDLSNVTSSETPRRRCDHVFRTALGSDSEIRTLNKAGFSGLGKPQTTSICQKPNASGSDLERSACHTLVLTYGGLSPRSHGGI
ncbi:hypothetical protein Bbelb_046350 [Branchiostoma belcheri]|nr:hypothetical protein Bbelb_046350 [Branchiostoma belcheri]